MGALPCTPRRRSIVTRAGRKSPWRRHTRSAAHQKVDGGVTRLLRCPEQPFIRKRFAPPGAVRLTNIREWGGNPEDLAVHACVRFEPGSLPPSGGASDQRPPEHGTPTRPGASPRTGLNCAPLGATLAVSAAKWRIGLPSSQLTSLRRLVICASQTAEIGRPMTRSVPLR
jgi:hypothetical protein